jgi:hypothetical protein
VPALTIVQYGWALVPDPLSEQPDPPTYRVVGAANAGPAVNVAATASAANGTAASADRPKRIRGVDIRPPEVREPSPPRKWLPEDHVNAKSPAPDAFDVDSFNVDYRTTDLPSCHMRRSRRVSKYQRSVVVEDDRLPPSFA